MSSQAAALPTHVLMPSIVCRTLCTFISVAVCRDSRAQQEQSTIPFSAEWCFARSARRFFDFAHVLIGKPIPTFPGHALDRRFRVRSEIVIERHPAVGDVVLLPARRPPGERELRFDDLLEQRVRPYVFLGDLVVQ